MRVAVLVPCFNEEAAVAAVVADFRKVLLAATIYVYDNNSSDRTAATARKSRCAFFMVIGTFLALVSIGLAIPVIITYLEEGIVPRLPTAVLSTGLMIVAVLSVSSGLVLDTVTRGRREMKLLAYLSQPPVG
jgi:hypothetical protein